MKTITFKNRSFEATLDLEALPGHSARKTRKLFKQLFADPWENREAISDVTAWLENSDKEAKRSLYEANQAFGRDYRIVNPYSRRPDDVDQRKLNRQLTNTLHHAKRCLQNLEKLQSIFQEFNN